MSLLTLDIDKYDYKFITGDFSLLNSVCFLIRVIKWIKLFLFESHLVLFETCDLTLFDCEIYSGSIDFLMLPESYVTIDFKDSYSMFGFLFFIFFF